MGKDTELFTDLVFGITGAFIDIGEVNNDKHTCRPIIKPANWWQSLLGRTKKYPTEIPIKNLIRCDMKSVYKGQFRTNWVVIPWEGCQKIAMNDTVFGQLQVKLDSEVGKLRALISKHDEDMYLLERQIKKLQAEKLAGRRTSERLRCTKDSCDKTYTRDEAEALGYICSTCKSQIRRPNE